jgi:hypothetical protein
MSGLVKGLFMGVYVLISRKELFYLLLMRYLYL